MSLKGSGSKPLCPTHQANASLDQIPVQNTWYTVLDTTKNARIISFGAYVETNDETIEGRITIDSQVLTVSATNFTAGIALAANFYNDASDALVWIALGPTGYRAFLIEGKSLKIEVRKTTAAGANLLHAKVRYAKW